MVTLSAWMDGCHAYRKANSDRRRLYDDDGYHFSDFNGRGILAIGAVLLICGPLP